MGLNCIVYTSEKVILPVEWRNVVTLVQHHFKKREVIADARGRLFANCLKQEQDQVWSFSVQTQGLKPFYEF